MNIQRFFGGTFPEADYLNELWRDKNKFRKVSKGKTKIPNMQRYKHTYGGFQEVDRKYSHLFIRKALHDYLILNACKGVLHIQAHYPQADVEDEIERLLFSKHDITARSRY